MSSYKFDKAKLREEINCNLHNENTTIYHILCKRPLDSITLDTTHFIVKTYYDPKEDRTYLYPTKEVVKSLSKPFFPKPSMIKTEQPFYRKDEVKNFMTTTISYLNHISSKDSYRLARKRNPLLHYTVTSDSKTSSINKLNSTVKHVFDVKQLYSPILSKPSPSPTARSRQSNKLKSAIGKLSQLRNSLIIPSHNFSTDEECKYSKKYKHTSIISPSKPNKSEFGIAVKNNYAQSFIEEPKTAPSKEKHKNASITYTRPQTYKISLATTKVSKFLNSTLQMKAYLSASKNIDKGHGKIATSKLNKTISPETTRTIKHKKQEPIKSLRLSLQETDLYDERRQDNV